MPTIYLVRHGQASFGAADYDVLSPMGEQQSKVLGEELRRRELRIDRVWSGRLRRQQATARACLSVAGVELPCEVDPRFDEYDTDAVLRHVIEHTTGGVTPSTRDFQPLLEAALLPWVTGEDTTGVLGEWSAFVDGATGALREAFAGLGKGGTGLVFTSGGIISAICYAILGLPPKGFITLNRTMVNAGLTKIVSGRSGLSLLALNEHGHFEGVHRELLSYR
jgi:broad specificity phosphatase PhoE